MSALAPSPAAHAQCGHCPPSAPFAANPAAVLVYPCQHAVRSCCIVRLMRASSVVATLDCPVCTDPVSVMQLDVAAVTLGAPPPDAPSSS